MKRFVACFLLLVSCLLLLVASASAQVSPDTVNGWYFIWSSAPINVASMRIVSDTAHEGTRSQGFRWESNPEVFVEWEKIFDTTYQTPRFIAISYWLNLLEPVPQGGASAGFRIYFGNSDTLHPLQEAILPNDLMRVWFNGGFETNEYPNPPSSFNRVRIRVRSSTLRSEWFFDNLQLWTPPASPFLIDRFGDGLVGVEDDGDQFSVISYQLHQNYPNPFNPATVISFQLSVRSFVTLKVYNLLGEEVAVLAEGEKNPGTHTVRFDPSDLPSGVYFYRLRATSENGETVTLSRKMVFLK